MKSKRKSLTGGEIPKRKRDKLKAQATYTPNKDARRIWESQVDEANRHKKKMEANKKFNKNKWFFQKEKYTGPKEGQYSTLGRFTNGEWKKF